jgi:Protein of unknown function (DUF2975)
VLPETRSAWSPLEPAASVVAVLLVLNTVVLVVGVVASVAGSGSFMGLGHGSVSVDVPFTAGSSGLPLGPWILRGEVTPNTIGYHFVVSHPDIGQRVWYTLTMFPGFLLFTGALLLVYRLIRGAARDGIYTSATAKRLRAIGWFLLIGALARATVEMVAANRMLATMVTNQVGWIGPIGWQLPWTMLLTAVGLLSFARIMRLGAIMQDDLQGTV